MRRALFTRPAPLALVAALAALGTSGCRSHDDPNEIVAAGHVEATDVRVATKIPGTLATLAPEEGDVVAAGQVVATIDTTDLLLTLATAHAERDAADADLRLKRAGARPEEIAEAKALLAQAEADLAGAQRELDRFQGLVDSGSGIVRTRDEALTRRDVSARAVAAARERLRRLEAGFRPQEIDAAAARRGAAEARIGQLEQQVKDASIVAPRAGIVTSRLHEPGEILAAGAVLLVVTDLNDAWLTAYLGERDLGRIRLGQEARVVTDDGQSRTGKVTFVASQAEFTPKNVQTAEEREKLVYRVKIALPNGDGLFKPGMPATARLAAAGAAAAGAAK
jgi:HlyD family secretion protein